MERGHSRARSDQITYHPAQYSPPKPFPPSYMNPTNPLQPHRSYDEQYGRDPFLADSTKDGALNGPRAWHIQSQGNPPPSNAPPVFHNPAPPTSASSSTTLLYGGINKPQAYDVSRRRSLGAPVLDSPFHHPTTYDQRAMPPPSPPQILHPATIPQPNSGAHGPPTASPFVGIRDPANLSSTRRHGAGMSISSMLGGGGDDRKPPSSPHSATTQPSTTPRTMQPTSPGRARAASMREPYYSGFREVSPGRRVAEPASASYDRTEFRQARDDGFGTQKNGHDTVNGFRSFYTSDQHAHTGNGHALPGRPISQPSTQTASLHRNEELGTDRTGMFRAFGQDGRHAPHETRDVNAFHDLSRAGFRDRAEFRPAHQDAAASQPRQDEQQAGLFRPGYPMQQTEYRPHESIEARSFGYDRREPGRVTPPSATYPDPFRNNGAYDRPLTYEEHQRMETGRKDSDGFIRRSIFNISPEMMRRGRDSPLPQAVQGARSRHVGPGGDHPSIKSEFGRMFSGLGSGVGRATPVAGQSANGNTTPSRILSPTAGDLRYDQDDGRSAIARLGRKQARKARDDPEELYDGRLTPSLSARGGKRAKTTHPVHHHHHHHHHAHHHHHDNADASSYSMIRYPSNPAQTPQSAHRHHHHHHAHPPQQHHHHHTPRPMQIRKPPVSVISDSVLKAVADKPRKHLGSMPYASTITPPRDGDLNYKLLYESNTSALPRFEGKDNCLFTVRVPKWIVGRTKEEIDNGETGRLEEICKNRHVWGSDIYTDDSDVVAAAVHAGWIRGDFGIATEMLQAIDDDEEVDISNGHGPPLTLESKPARPIAIPDGYDMHISVLILPPLEAYASTHKHHLTSRSWDSGAPHDGMSYMVHRVEFVMEGNADRGVERSARSRKSRMAAEQLKRREAAAALLVLPDVRVVNNAVSAGV